MKKFILLTSIILTNSLPACDLCGCYTPSAPAVKKSDHGFYASIAEQFTYFGSLRVDGHEVDNPTDQYLASSNTQFVIGQSFFDHKLTVQANLPYIYREYERPEGFTTDRGHESGLGDASLLASYEVWNTSSTVAKTKDATNDKGDKRSVEIEKTSPWSASLRLIGGIKFPTGDASRLSEEFAEGHDHEEEHSHEEGGEHEEIEAPENGIHGHDLALGTGSYDALIGAEIFTRYDRFFFEAETQFTLRGDGRYSYHFANDLTWSGSLGYYLLDRENASLAVAVATSGETKYTDRFQGRVAEDTGITSVYLGPKITARYAQFSAELGFELPLLLDNTALQAVPNYRIRAAVNFHF